MKKAFSYINISQTVKTIYCLFILLTIIGVSSHAQPPDIGGDVDNVPIDGGLSLLVAAGMGYGIKKMKARQHK